MKKIGALFCPVFTLFLSAHSLAYQTSYRTEEDLFSMDFQELMNINITSVSKQDEKFKETASAIFVLNNEDIRRSGLTSFAELMRLVPGMQVAQKNANVWGITSRGFNATRANKLLVLIDGRSVYSALYAGVFWDQLDYILNDIERIEVIRGPGGAIWGTNAVSGVVNVITKKAQKTQGGYLSMRLGRNERRIAEGRYGGAIGDSTYYRFYVKSSKYDGMVFANDANRNRTDDAAGKETGDDSFDDWALNSSGFNIQHWATDNDEVNFSADFYAGTVDDSHDRDDEDLDGYNVNARWDHTFADNSKFYIQGYFNHFYRLDGENEDPSAILRELDMLDIDMVFSTHYGRHALTMGGGYRYSDDKTNIRSRLSVVPEKKQDDLYSLFIQDKITLIDDQLFLTLGTKVEDNDETGVEVQPTLRILQNIDQNHTLWGAISGSNRLPSRVENDDRRRGSVDLDAEKAVSYELGHRYINQTFSVDSTVFHVAYDEMIAINNDASSSGSYDNIYDGKSHGFESSFTWHVNNNWNVSGSYSYLNIELELKEGFIDQFNSLERNESAPENQYTLRSNWDLSKNLELDIYYYYVGKLIHNVDSGTGEGVDSYSRVDIRLGWLYKNIEIYAGVQNMFEEEHIEFSSTSRTGTAVERNIYAQFKFTY